jgi:hypothetical protein
VHHAEYSVIEIEKVLKYTVELMHEKSDRLLFLPLRCRQLGDHALPLAKLQQRLEDVTKRREAFTHKHCDVWLFNIPRIHPPDCW